MTPRARLRASARDGASDARSRTGFDRKEALESRPKAQPKTTTPLPAPAANPARDRDRRASRQAEAKPESVPVLAGPCARPEHRGEFAVRSGGRAAAAAAAGDRGRMSDKRLTYRFGPLERRGILGPIRAGQAATLGARGGAGDRGARHSSPTAAGALVATVAVRVAGGASRWRRSGRRTVEEWAPIAVAFAGRRLLGQAALSLAGAHARNARAAEAGARGRSRQARRSPRRRRRCAACGSSTPTTATGRSARSASTAGGG